MQDLRTQGNVAQGGQVDEDPTRVWSFADWLNETAQLQRDAYGADLPSYEGEQYANSVMMNVLAATDELHEYMQETDWKPWSKVRGRTGFHSAQVTEIVDVMHFLANIIVLERITPEELTAEYRKKVNLNRARQVNGYDGRTDKCRVCMRDLGEHPSEPCSV